ncbi:hypothetical protein F3Y22_tig00113716pilonHSYRG00088 [Hibiscus syriacus]|uniref:Protein kinase domain-containing protein n=1 Tax=Hibiscus syriacus TaxID=106335 RepID=A0A6A2X5A9_HIBSY|nr:hypothetical protein F3Y22_tig00113716pilonHSYRG00088 [Hibiscus syriacus]
MYFDNFEGKVPTKGVFNNSAFSVVGNNELCGGIKPLRLATCPTETAKKGKNFPRRAIIASGISLSRKKEDIATTSDRKHPKLSYTELLHATNSFSSANLIGKGRYGLVNKGILSGDDQTTVAVKVLNLQQRGADQTFKAECEALRKLRHRNLVKVITSCSSIDFQGNNFKALLFELIPNGSLENLLDPSSTKVHNLASLNLIQRLNISVDVASALDYLHSQFEGPVIHCDLKPSNILLDADLTAHISDFGLTRFLSEKIDQSISEQSSSVGIRGTMGYIHPGNSIPHRYNFVFDTMIIILMILSGIAKYGMSRKISTHVDMYSYGIILMELFTGKRPTDNMSTVELSLREYVKVAMPDHVMEIVDARLNCEHEAGAAFNQNGKCLGSVFSIGVSCSDDSPSERMNIKDVLRELHKARNMLLGDHKRRALQSFSSSKKALDIPIK